MKITIEDEENNVATYYEGAMVRLENEPETIELSTLDDAFIRLVRTGRGKLVVEFEYVNGPKDHPYDT